MQLERSFTVAGEPEHVWQFLRDGERVAACVPELKLERPADATAPQLTLHIAFDGPPVAYVGGASCTERDDAALRLAMAGRGVARFTGSLTVALTVTLSAADEAAGGGGTGGTGGTRVELTGTCDLTGKPSRLDAAVVQASLDSALDGTVARLREALDVPAVRDVAAEPEVPAEPVAAVEPAEQGAARTRRRPRPGPGATPVTAVTAVTAVPAVPSVQPATPSSTVRTFDAAADTVTAAEPDPATATAAPTATVTAPAPAPTRAAVPQPPPPLRSARSSVRRYLPVGGAALLAALLLRRRRRRRRSG